MKKQYLEAGKIVRTHGVRGELVLEVLGRFSPAFGGDQTVLF